MKTIEKWIDNATNFTQGIISLFLKLIFEFAPVLFVLFIIVAVIIKAFRVVVLGEQP
jgi:hypothetical protein